MAILKPSPLIGAITGTLGAVDFVQGATGLYVRKRPRSTIRRSPAVSLHRERFSTLINHWREMTESQRQAWRQAAALSNFRNRLGVPRRLSGFQLFLKINLSPIRRDTIDEVAPDTLTATAAPADVTIVRAPAADIFAEFTIDTPSPTQQVWIYCARPVSTSQRRHYSNYKLIAIGTAPTGANSVPIGGLFTPILGIPQVGERIGIRCRGKDPGRLPSYNVDGDGVML